MSLTLDRPDNLLKTKSPSIDTSDFEKNTNSNTDLMDSSLRLHPRYPQPFPIVRSKSAADNNYFQKSLENLLNLDEIDEDEIDDEDDIVKPSIYAFTEAYRLLNEVRNYFKTAFPYCASSLETRGGIDLVWDNLLLGRRVWVEIPAEKSLEGAVFYRERDKNEFFKGFDTQKIIRLLLWLNDSQTSIDNIAVCKQPRSIKYDLNQGFGGFIVPHPNKNCYV